MKLKSFAAKTDQGPYLKINEDNYDIDLVNGLFMLFDGIGGSGIGDRCVDRLKENIKSFYTRVNGNADATLPFFYSSKYLLEGNALINSLFFAHKNLYKENRKTELNYRASASGVVAALSESILTFASVGNCQTYLYRKGKFLKLFLEDSLIYLSVDFYKSYLKTCPLNGFGLFEDVHPSIKELRVLNGDLILFLTDGAYSRLEEDEIKYIIEKVDYTYEEKIVDLFSMANTRGNLDNQSAIILKF